MSAYRVAPLTQDDEAGAERAAHLLVDGFRDDHPDAWPTIESARLELFEALQPERAAFAARDERGEVVGWIGGIPTYDGRVWELHPLVVGAAHRRRGVARALVAALEEHARGHGALTLWLGSDDEANQTSLGGAELFPDLLGRLSSIENVREHPFTIYQKLGFQLAGVVPDANGFGKPDILMAKTLRR